MPVRVNPARMAGHATTLGLAGSNAHVLKDSLVLHANKVITFLPANIHSPLSRRILYLADVCVLEHHVWNTSSG